MNKRVDYSKSRCPTNSRGRAAGPSRGDGDALDRISSRSHPASDSVCDEAGPTDALVAEPLSTLSLLHISHNYMNPYQKPQWYEPVVYSGSIRKVHLLEALVALDSQLQSVMRNSDFLRDWPQYTSIRSAIQQQFIDLLKFEMKFCRQHNVEQHCWKMLYYNVIEYMKRLCGDKSTPNGLFYRQKCLHIIDDGGEFFERLLGIITATYKFDMDDYVGANSGTPLKGLKYISLAIVSAQKICIYLGDLLRYREIVDGGKNFERVKQWYVRAYQLIPANGMPYNQLAILSLYNKRKFDAIYYHLRSLHASNPIKSAKESLVVMFDEIRKKYETHERTLMMVAKKRGTSSMAGRRNETFRRELWIHPTYGQLNYRTVCLDENDDESVVLDSVGLYKKFIANYLHLQGMLFTKIGADSLETCIDSVLKEFAELLDHQSSDVMTHKKLVNLITLNAFGIDYNRNETAPSDLLINSVAFSFCFFGLMIEKLLKEFIENVPAAFCDVKGNANHLLVTGENTTADEQKCHRHSTGQSNNTVHINDFILSDYVNNLLAAVMLWCNWMQHHCALWNSPPILSAMKCLCEKYGIVNVWGGFATLITIFGEYRFDEHRLLLTEPPRPPADDDNENVRPSSARLRLPEDLLVLGLPSFVSNETFYCRDQHNRTNLFTMLRMRQVRLFATEFLCTCEPPILQKHQFAEALAVSFTACAHETFGDSVAGNYDGDGDGDEGGMAATAAVTCSGANKSSDGITRTAPTRRSSFEDDECDIGDRVTAELETEAKTVGSAENSPTTEIQQLVQRKNELERSHKMHEKQHQHKRDILQQSKNDTILIEVQPKYLLSDTNCFIDSLAHLISIAESYPLYQLIVPLIVLNELEGLAKGDRLTDESPTRSQTKTHRETAAQAALAFLQINNKNIRYATTKGSILTSMAFTTERDCSDLHRDGATPIEHRNNDDKILLTASNLSQLHSSNFTDGVPDVAQPSNVAAVAASPPKSTIRHKVVLLTNDRNLRVKAIAQNIPVREALDFVKWSDISH